MRTQRETFGYLVNASPAALASSRLACFDGLPLHENVFAMAAAYLYHIVKNHPFLDGNKRTGLIVRADVFGDQRNTAPTSF